MAQMVITLAFETLKAQLELAGQTIVLDEFVLANVPGQDANTPIDRSETLPPASQIVFTGAVTQSGFVNPNAVIYSLIMDTGIGDFSFNWIGLRNKAQGTLAAISHIPTINKIKSVPGVKNGNSVTRSMMMSYVGAQTATGITVDAATWQIDFTARLTSIDKTEQLANVDHYGHNAFLEHGYQVFKSGSSYKTSAGIGYVGGLRCHATAEQVISNVANNCSIYLDASWQGGLTSEWQTEVHIKASAQVLTDYVDSTGLQHYVTKLAEINSAGNVIDCRTLGGTPALERKDNAATNSDIDNNSVADKHVKLTQFWRGISNKITAAFQGRTISTTSPLKGGGNLSANRTFSIDNASTAGKGAVQLSSSTISTSTTLAATPSAVKATMDKANTGVSNAATAQAKANSAHTLAASKWVYVAGTTAAIGAVKLSTSTTSISTTLAATPSAVKVAMDKANTGVSDAATAQTKADSAHSLAASKWRYVAGTTAVIGAVKLSTSTTSTSTTLAATPSAVKVAMDKAIEALNIAHNGAPAGMPQPWPKTNPPSGWLACRGQVFNKTTYPQLAIAYPSGVLPDLRGEFIRGWDNGRGVDVGRNILSPQADAFQGHSFGSSTDGRWSEGVGVYKLPGQSSQSGSSGYTANSLGEPLRLGSFGTPRIAFETRSRSIAFMYIVRAA